MNPAAEVHLVNRDRLIEGVTTISTADPGVIIPLKSVEMTNDGACIRPDFMLEAVGVSLLIAMPVLGADFVFIEVLPQAREQTTPRSPPAFAASGDSGRPMN